MPTDTEMGEYLVGAYLSVVEECDFVDYNIHPPGGGQRGLEEFDVVAFNFEKRTAFLCEVTTHIRGLLYKDYNTTVERISGKFKRQRTYAQERLAFMRKHRFMFWSPVVSSGLVERLKHIRGLELVVNEDYAKCIGQLQRSAKVYSHDVGNPAFRVLQILAHMKKDTSEIAK
jgi:hypothetical protein